MKSKRDTDRKTAIHNHLGHKSDRIRKFETGADRSSDHDKLDFEGFLSPYALERFARYMHTHRTRADGTLRDSDNWQKGIPLSSYIKSMWRHFFALWKAYRQNKTDELEENLCAMMFNVQGALHEITKPRRKA